MPSLKESKAYKDSKKGEGAKEATDDVEIKRHLNEKPYCNLCKRVTKEKGKRFGHKSKSNLHYFCKAHGRLEPDQIHWK